MRSWKDRLAALAILIMASGCPTRAPEARLPDSAPLPDRPQVILFIGDGMGKNHEIIASHYATGTPDGLAMHSLPVRGEILTASPSGLTDSAAAATAMSSGVLTYNARVALDRDGLEVETILELAKARGLSTGLVTTTLLPHATPASFGAHRLSRGELRGIAEDYVTRSKPDVMLGGGATYFSGDDETINLFESLRTDGYRIIDTRSQLESFEPALTPKLFGTFASSHMAYARARRGSGSTPDLPMMTAAALRILERNPNGFVLVVEGGRIDHAAHANLVEDVIGDTLEFDDAIGQTLLWAEGREVVTMLVTADHECGGLDLISPRPASQLPEVSWRWGNHTNRRVSVYGSGSASEIFDRTLRDHRAVYAAMRAAVTGDEPEIPERALLPNGHHGELRYAVAEQTRATDFGSRGRLAGLRVDADDRDLGIGIEGTYSFDDSAVVVFIDVDYGSETGARVLEAAPLAREDPVDNLIERLAVSLELDGFGADLVAVSISGSESRTAGPIGLAGWRGLDAIGKPIAAGAPGVAINYDSGTRHRPRAGAIAAPLSGVELGVPLSNLFPSGVPAGARVAIVCVLTNADGSVRSNQAMPPLGISDDKIISAALIELDRDGDGVIDDDLAVSLVP